MTATSQRISLSGPWQLAHGPDDDAAPQNPAEMQRACRRWIAAAVPGNVELDLSAAGELPRDLHHANNIYALRDIESHQFWYRRTFRVRSLAAGEIARITFAGIDCLATIWIDGRLLGETQNMLIEHRFDLPRRLCDGREHEIVIRIRSAVLEGRRRAMPAYTFSQSGSPESLPIRKAPHMYGWDIMPRAVSAGLWRDVWIDILPATRLGNVKWTTLQIDPQSRTASVQVAFAVHRDQSSTDDPCVVITIAGQRSVRPIDAKPTIALHDVDAWWPRGYGDAPLYDATIQLLDSAGRVTDSRTDRIGFRTIELRRTDVTTPENPGEFVFVVNGEKIFVKGTNWVALDALHSRDRARLKSTFDMAVDLNCNMLRCWGGNVYENHEFFELCDQNGVMVWQDFALACGIYPQDEAMFDAMRVEAEAVVTKLWNHPSLVLWAGNNEIDEAYGWANSPLDPNQHDQISRRVLRDVVQRLDPSRPYLPSSPYRSAALVASGNVDALKPEDHLWGPRDDFKGAFYTSSPAHFVSEIGYHGCPNRAALEAMMDAQHLWPWQDNDQWLTHAVRPVLDDTRYNYRIELMTKQIRLLFGDVPATLDAFIEASQISQAEALKFFIESWRMQKWRRTGILWWNLRDGWPIISDAIVDYFGGKKLAYDVVKNSQQDVCVMAGEADGEWRPIVAVNDTRRDVPLRVRVSDAATDQTFLVTETRLMSNGFTDLGKISAKISTSVLKIAWHAGDDRERTNHYISAPRPWKIDIYHGVKPLFVRQ